MKIIVGDCNFIKPGGLGGDIFLWGAMLVSDLSDLLLPTSTQNLYGDPGRRTAQRCQGRPLKELNFFLVPGGTYCKPWTRKRRRQCPSLTSSLSHANSSRMKSSSAVTTSEAHPSAHSSSDDSDLERVKQVALGNSS